MNNPSEKKYGKLVFRVSENDELLPFLMKKMSGISRTKAKGILASGVVTVDGQSTTQHNFPVRPGMTVTMERNGGGNMLKNRWVRIVYEDKYLLVVEKRNGILSNSIHPGDETVQKILNRYLENKHLRCHAHTIHRLDRDTSGLMLFAKSKEIALKFEDDWKGTVYDRRYVALVHGEMRKSDGAISSWLKDDEHFVTYSSKTDNGGKFAVTRYKVLKVCDGYSLVELRLETGRKNQIRVHLQDIGYPVVGDPKYGDGDNSIGRLGLHAYKLCFTHPVNGNDMKFETPFPKGFDI
ncbi:MAG: RluA family pseudouridine synthase [Bacteroidales bacterium]|nr:RluA family pseudouridine synthase [Bacteroidales bacterium]